MNPYEEKNIYVYIYINFKNNKFNKFENSQRQSTT